MARGPALFSALALAVLTAAPAGASTTARTFVIERYLRGVVPWEMPHRWSAQALEAQSVAARSYALATLHPGQTFDLFADARDQE